MIAHVRRVPEVQVGRVLRPGWHARRDHLRVHAGMPLVMCNGEYVGSIREFEAWARRLYGYSDRTPDSLYASRARKALQRYMAEHAGRFDFLYLDLGVKGADGEDTSESAYYLCANRAKRSITHDLGRPEGIALDGTRVLVSSMRRGEIVAVDGGRAQVVSSLDGQTFRGLALDAERRRLWAGVASPDGTTGGLIAFGPGAAYASPNYRWFDARHADFLYVDRVVVDAACRGAGLGRALYGALRDHASGRTPLLACEVNEQPPNPASMAFHERFGFAAVGRQETEGGTKQVALMEMPLA